MLLPPYPAGTAARHWRAPLSSLSSPELGVRVPRGTSPPADVRPRVDPRPRPIPARALEGLAQWLPNRTVLRRGVHSSVEAELQPRSAAEQRPRLRLLTRLLAA